MSDKTPPPCWIDKKLKELSPADKSSPETKKKIYGIWRKYNKLTQKKITAECEKSKNTKKQVKKKK